MVVNERRPASACKRKCTLHPSWNREVREIIGRITEGVHCQSLDGRVFANKSVKWKLSESKILCQAEMNWGCNVIKGGGELRGVKEN